MATWEIDWTPADDAVVSSYNIYYAVDGGTRVYKASSVGSSIVLREIPEGRESVEFFVAPVVNGVEAPEDTWSSERVNLGTALSDIAVPTAPTNLRVVQNGSDIVATWDELEVTDLDYYELRWGGSASTWASAGKLLKVTAPGTRATFGWRYTGAVRIHIRAVLKSGQVGASAYAAITVRDDSDYVTQETNDESAGSFSGGTMTNVEYDGGSASLQPKALPASYTGWTDAYTSYTHPWWYEFIPGGNYETPTKDAGAVVEEKIEVDAWPTAASTDTDYTKWRGQYDPEFDDTVDSQVAATPGAKNIYDYVQSDGSASDGDDTEIQINISDDNITWSGWLPWMPGTVYRYRYVKMRIVFHLWWPFSIFRIGTFTWKRKRKNWKEEQVVTVAALGGTTVTFETVFSKTPVVTCTPISAAIPLNAIVVDGTPSKTGCTIQVFDSGGVERSGVDVNVSILGV